MLTRTRTATHNLPMGARGKGSIPVGRMPRVIEHPPPSPWENMRYDKSRIMKAERDERIDITKALTPVKTYMGGFTRPQDLRASNWWPGGRYRNIGKKYLTPPESAYEPHTVFLLESRYEVGHEIGRADTIEHVVGVCREGDLPAVMEMFNSSRSPEYEAMANARWPWLPKKRSKGVVWWGEDENPREEVRKLWAGEGPEFEEIPEEEIESLLLENFVEERPLWAPVPRKLDPPSRLRQEPQKPAQQKRAPPYMAVIRSSSKSSVVRARPFHTTALALHEDKTTTHAQRAQIPTSSWSRPPKESQDANDDVVPAYYIERRRQLDEISERKETEGGLMAQLSAGILSEGIAAQTRPREEKIPVEVKEEDGVVRHPSGFEPPTPETEFHPMAAKPNLLDHPILTTVKMAWDEALDPSSNEGNDDVAGMSSRTGGSSKLSRGFHTSAMVRAREVDLPLDVLKSHANATGVDASTSAVEEDLEDGVFNREEEQDVKAQENETDEAEEAADEFDATQSQLRIGRPPDRRLEFDSSKWLATLKKKPFWRPILTATFSTRPLACTFARLSRSHPRGLPFYASTADADRKYGVSFSARMREMRLRRMTGLAMDVARLMHGERGGFIGIRFSQEERGRTIDPEGLADPIPVDKRVVKVGVADWYQFSDSVKETLRQHGEDAEIGDGLQVFGLDDFGQRTDGVAWPEVEPLPRSLSVQREALKHLTEEQKENLARRERNRLVDEYVLSHQNEIMSALSGDGIRHKAVCYPPYKPTQSSEETTETSS